MAGSALVNVGESADGDQGTRARLVTAAVEAFSASGYDGVSVREIERQAGANRGLVAYHFGSKEALWQESVSWLMARFHDEFVPYQETFREVSPAERERVLLIVFTRFCAKYPQYFRLLVLEGDVESERTSWFVEQHLRPTIAFFNRVVGRPMGESAGSDLVAHFAFMGTAAMVFAVPAFSRMMFGVEPTDPGFLDVFVHVAARVGTLLPQLFEDAVNAQRTVS
jgi:TetR/AcrR family transcriptional regulator